LLHTAEKTCIGKCLPARQRNLEIFIIWLFFSTVPWLFWRCFVYVSPRLHM